MENKKLYLYGDEYDLIINALDGWIHKDKLYYDSINNIEKDTIIRALEDYISCLEVTDAELTDHLDWNTRICMHCCGEIDLCEEKYYAEKERKFLHKVKSILGPKNINLVDIIIT